LGSLAVLAFNWPGLPLAAFLSTPTQAAGQTELPPSVTVPPATLPPSATVQPSQTPDLAATQTAGAPPPTATVPSPTFTATLPPTATALPPTRTPLVYEFTLVGREDQSIFLVNTGALALPLAPLQLGEGSRALSGQEWQVAELQNGQCVAAWINGSKPPIPKDLKCERVGENVLRSSSSRRFWTRAYKVFYNDQEIAACNTREEPCVVQFSIP
jgi:hypothetical protein